MDIEKFTQALDPDIIARFRRAIETGKWPDGRQLTARQKATCMQALIAYEHRHVGETERTGYVPPKKSPCDPGEEDDQPIKWT